MEISRFIASGDSAAGCLKLRNQLLKQFHPIVPILDQFEMGPLQDADQSWPTQRITWWKSVWAAQWWENKENTTFLDQYAVTHQKQLLSTLSSAAPIVVWIGNTAHDKLMLAMIASLTSPQIPLSVIDITGQVPHQHHGYYAVGMCPPKALLHLTPRLLSNQERAILSQQWLYWRKHGQGWREVENGKVTEYSLDHLDTILLTKIAELGRKSIMRIVGDVVGQYPGIVSDGFLFWRLEVLRQANKVIFLNSDPEPGRLQVELA